MSESIWAFWVIFCSFVVKDTSLTQVMAVSRYVCGLCFKHGTARIAATDSATSLLPQPSLVHLAQLLLLLSKPPQLFDILSTLRGVGAGPPEIFAHRCTQQGSGMLLLGHCLQCWRTAGHEIAH